LCPAKVANWRYEEVGPLCNKGELEVNKPIRIFGVQMSVYYVELQQGMSLRQEKNIQSLFLIREIWRKSRGLYSSPLIMAKLRFSGVCCGENRIAQLTWEAGIKVRTKNGLK